MSERTELYSGKAKTLYLTDDKEQLILHFRDDATAFNAQKTGTLLRKGLVNNCFNAFIMQKLQQAGIATHFIKRLSENESLVKRLTMIPVECVVRNRAAGGLSKRLGLEEGVELNPPVFEFFYKDDELGDPMINDYHILSFGWANEQQIEEMKALTFQVNQVLTKLFTDVGIWLIDFKLEFGLFNGELCLGDEFTPDGCRLWDEKTQEKLDKDRFRRDLGQVIESYEIVAERLGIELA